jgi:hypothetical protein
MEFCVIKNLSCAVAKADFSCRATERRLYKWMPSVTINTADTYSQHYQSWVGIGQATVYLSAGMRLLKKTMFTLRFCSVPVHFAYVSLHPVLSHCELSFRSNSLLPHLLAHQIKTKWLTQFSNQLTLYIRVVIICTTCCGI